MFALRASTSAGLLRFPVRTVARWPVNYAASIAGGLGDASSSSRHFLKRTDWTPVRAASTDQAFSERRRRRQPSANRGRYYMKAILLHGMPQDRPVSELKEMVMKRFSKFGHVKFAMAGETDDGKPDGTAAVEFHLTDDAAKAMRSYHDNQIEFGPEPIKMQFAARSIQSLIESRTLHVLGLARHTEEDTIRDHFMQYGNVLNVRFGRQRGTAYVDYATTEEGIRAMKAHDAEPFIIDGSELDVIYTTPTGDQNLVSGVEEPEPLVEKIPNPPYSRITVQKFPFPTESAIINTFEAFGEIEWFTINYWKDRPSTNIVFVQYSSVEEATAAMEAYQSGQLASISPSLRMAYYKPLPDYPAYHTLLIRGYTGGFEALVQLVQPFKGEVWRVNDKSGMLIGQGAGTGFVEFDTVEHAVEARKQLQGQRVNGIPLEVVFARPPAIPAMEGGVNYRDHGGEEFAFALEGGGHDKDVGARLFETVNRRGRWARLHLISHYLGKDWERPNVSDAEIVREIMKRRAIKEQLSNTASDEAVASDAAGSAPTSTPSTPVSEEADSAPTSTPVTPVSEEADSAPTSTTSTPVSEEADSAPTSTKSTSE